MNVSPHAAVAIALALCSSAKPHGATIVGRIVDAQTGKPLAARVYVENAKAEWFFVQSTSAKGTAVPYDKTNWMQKQSFEKHTTISADPFKANLPPGEYTITVERGKEYFTETRQVSLGQADASVKIRLHRWIKISAAPVPR